MLNLSNENGGSDEFHLAAWWSIIYFVLSAFGVLIYHLETPPISALRKRPYKYNALLSDNLVHCTIDYIADL